MPYPMEWLSDSAEPTIKSGVVTFKVEGRDYSIPLPSFSDAMEISKMLDMCFWQGKDFAFNVLRSNISSEFDRSSMAHSLSMPKPHKPAGDQK